MEETRNAPSPCSDVVDRISRLPDNLIHQIMSFNDTKYAVQTSVLSKRWIHIWKSLPFLNFNRNSFSHENTDKFIEFVYMVFMFRDDTNVQRFSVAWESSEVDKTVMMNVNRWSLNAVKYNVNEVIIDMDQPDNLAYEIPHRLLNCESLRKLQIQVIVTAGYADIILPRSMNLPQLKELILDGFSFSNVESYKLLLSSCPVIETLQIIDCDRHTDNQRNLIVDSVSLKKFTYTCWLDYAMPNIIKLCAPNLEEFNCRSFFTQDYSLQNCSPLSRVYFYMVLDGKEEDENAETYSRLPSMVKDTYAKRMRVLLGTVSMVKEIGSSPGFLEVLSQAPDLLGCQPLRLCNLYRLVLEMWFTKGCLRAIAYLLKISPHITQLFLVSKKSNSADVGDDWEVGLLSAEMLSHLNFVQIEHVEGCVAEFKLLSFLLKNAEVLEKVVLFFGSSVGSPDRMRQVEQFKDKLRAVPAASSCIQLVFET